MKASITKTPHMNTDRPIPDFSPREKQLLEYAAAGFTDSAIANKLGISEATVSTYWGRVRIKLGPYSRTELVAIVLRAESKAALEALEQENEELIRQLQVDIASNKSDFYRVLLDNAPDAMIIVADSGDLQYANAAAAESWNFYERAVGDAKSIFDMKNIPTTDIYKPNPGSSAPATDRPVPIINKGKPTLPTGGDKK
jgi:DNA-binding CsgD family transcriptional regulator